MLTHLIRAAFAVALLAALAAAQQISLTWASGEDVARTTIATSPASWQLDDSHPGPLVAEFAALPLEAEGGQVLAEGFVWVYFDRLGSGAYAIEALISNGSLERFRGPIVGAATLEASGFGDDLNGAVSTALTIFDGCAASLRLGRMRYRPDPAVADWYVRHGPSEWPEAQRARLRGLRSAGPSPDKRYTGQTGSPRNIVARWPLGVAMILRSSWGEALEPEIFDEVARWTDEQHVLRSVRYYDDAGEPWRAMLTPAVDRVEGGGTGGGGGLVGAAGRPASWSGNPNPANAYDLQHFEAERLLMAYALTGSRAARAGAIALLEAALSQYPAPMPQPVDGNQRGMAWPLRAAALGYRVLGNPDYATLAQNILGCIRLSHGQNGPWRWPSLAPARTDHVWPHVDDLRAYVAWRGWDWDPAWQGLDDLRPFLRARGAEETGSQWTYLFEILDGYRGVCVWQTGLLAYAIGQARDAGALAPLEALPSSDERSAAYLHRWVLLCLLQSARTPGRSVLSGASETTPVFWVDYAPLVGRVRAYAPSQSLFNGTAKWVAVGLAHGARDWAGARPALRGMVSDLQGAVTNWGSWDDNIGTWWDTLDTWGWH